jgi:MFS family permease
MTPKTQRGFSGWWMTAMLFVTFGLSTGMPYYGGPFFYDYYAKEFGWSKSEITYGFPLAAALTLWVGPLIVPRISPRRSILIGTGLTALAFLGFSQMTGNLAVYYALWVVYVLGYILSGPIPHQVIVSNWFRKRRGIAIAIVYTGVGILAAVVPKFVARPITEAVGFRQALLAFAAMLVIVWPIALFLLRDKPADLGQFPDGGDHLPEDSKGAPQPVSGILTQSAFWLLLIGSMMSIGSIGSINQHMKFVLQAQGFTNQTTLNDMWTTANFWVAMSSVAGRLFMGYLADRFSKKWVMLATYALVAGTIPLLQLVTPASPNNVYIFACLFGFGLGADYMLIPLMAAEQFGVNTLARAMSIILPTDTIGQTWFPFLIAKLYESFGSYDMPLKVVFALSAIGAVAIMLLPSNKKEEPVLGDATAAVSR